MITRKKLKNEVDVHCYGNGRTLEVFGGQEAQDGAVAGTMPGLGSNVESSKQSGRAIRAQETTLKSKAL
jgi:hypothetical protein